MAERMLGADSGHAALLAWIDALADGAGKSEGCAHANLIKTGTSSATASRSRTRCSAPAHRRCLLMPTWSIVHSRFWKLQIPYLARHFRVVTFDGRGCGRSDRPVGAEAYAGCRVRRRHAGRAGRHGHRPGGPGRAVVRLRVGDAARGRPSGARRSGSSRSVRRSGSAARHEERTRWAWDERHDTTEGWAKFNRHYWLEGDYDDFLEFFFGQMFSEPHSTKQIEDCRRVGERDRAGHVGRHRAWSRSFSASAFAETCQAGPVPGARDPRQRGLTSARTQNGVGLAELTGGSLVTVDGGGHGQPGRDPVLVNRLVRDFVHQLAPTPTRRGRRGHARCAGRSARSTSRRRSASVTRSVTSRSRSSSASAIPDLEIDWLPSTR